MSHAAPRPSGSGFNAGAPELPTHHMRGGTSTGAILRESLLPSDRALREEALRRLMGVPLGGEHPGNRQITGLGRGPATSNKVFLARVEDHDGAPRIVSTLAQLAADHGRIDWSVNCGNMSSALPLWALDCGLIAAPAPGPVEIGIFNTNTGATMTARMTRNEAGGFLTTEIPGVPGAFPQVDLFLHDPAGAKTGLLLPTGRAREEIAGCAASCVDAAVPMVVVNAADLGKTAHESPAALEADADFMRRFREIWIEGALRMGLRRKDGAVMTRDEVGRSETIPKACIVGRPRAGGHVAARYFTPQTAHASLAVSGGCCLAAAALIPGSVANLIAEGLPAACGNDANIAVAIENPAGLLDTEMDCRITGGALLIRRAAYRRNAQILMRGQAPLYGASDALIAALQRRAEG